MHAAGSRHYRASSEPWTDLDRKIPFHKLNILRFDRKKKKFNRAPSEGILKTIVDKYLWQVGGRGLTDDADAAAYLICLGDEAALIDSGTGKNHSRLLRNISQCIGDKVNIKYLLLTHCHYDHSGGAVQVQKDFGCKIAAHELDAVYLEAADDVATAASWYGAHMEPFHIDIKFSEEEAIVDVGNGSLTAIHWPGHSPGSTVYTVKVEGHHVLFGQDVHGPLHPSLRSDREQYQASLKKLLNIDSDLLLEGHFGVIQGRNEVRRFIRSFFE